MPWISFLQWLWLKVVGCLFVEASVGVCQLRNATSNYTAVSLWRENRRAAAQHTGGTPNPEIKPLQLGYDWRWLQWLHPNWRWNFSDEDVAIKRQVEHFDWTKSNSQPSTIANSFDSTERWTNAGKTCCTAHHLRRKCLPSHTPHPTHPVTFTSHDCYVAVTHANLNLHFPLLLGWGRCNIYQWHEFYCSFWYTNLEHNWDGFSVHHVSTLSCTSRWRKHLLMAASLQARAPSIAAKSCWNQRISGNVKQLAKYSA